MKGAAMKNTNDLENAQDLTDCALDKATIDGNRF